MGCLKQINYLAESKPTLKVVWNRSNFEHPFGMLMPGRHASSESYRYGAFGYEGDTEVKGQGNSYTTEFRQYDSRLGRWLSMDPRAAKYPTESPYVAFHNNPVFFTDPRGDDPPEKVVPQVAKEIAENASFGPTKNYYNKNGKGEITINYDDKVKSYFLQYSGTRKPSQIMEDVVNMVKSGNHQIDCGFYVALVYAYSVNKIMDDKDFDKMFYDKETKTYKMGFDQVGFTNLNHETYVYEAGEDGQKRAATDANRVKVGTLLSLTAVDKGKALPNYQHENFIKVGNDQYAAFPFTKGKDAKFFTLDELKARAKAEGSKDANNQTEYALTKIRVVPVPSGD